jgi:hypothetical protein
MSPLHCNTVQEALWERAASAGPAPLSPTLADHLASCPICQAERVAVRALVDVTASFRDPEPPEDIWDGFEEDLQQRIDKIGAPASSVMKGRWTRRAMALAATLVLGFVLGALSMRISDPDRAAIDPVERDDLLADIEAQLGNDARLESYLTEIEDLLVAYRATEHGAAVDLFRRSLPTAMVAGSGVPSEADRSRLEHQRATREQLRSLVLGMLASEVESEAHGFGYLDRRIAAIAGQQLLYFIR